MTSVERLREEAAPSHKMGYRPALDGLRAVAIGLVLLEHTGLEIFDGGNSGVIIFFVLSGFLITKLMVEEWDTTGTLSVRAFYGRRFVRIMPAPLVMVAVLALLSTHLESTDAGRRYLWFELSMVVLYLYNMRPILFGTGGWFGAQLTPGTDTYLAHTWSLAVEEHFYLVWPWVLKGLRLPALRPVRVVGGLLGFALVATVARYVVDQYSNPDVVSIPVFNFDGFALGAALAFIVHHDLWPRFRELLGQWWVAPVASVVILADLLLRDQREDGSVYGYWYMSYIGLASVLLIGSLYLGGRRGLVGWVLTLPPSVWLGRLSYSLYLWHVPVQVYFSQERFPDWSVPRIVITEQLVTFAAMLASYYLIEMPARRLRRFFVPAAKPAATPAGSAPASAAPAGTEAPASAATVVAGTNGQGGR